MFVNDYLCDMCGHKALAFFGQPGYYLFGDGERIPAVSTAAWCRPCSSLTLVEGLPEVQFLSAQLHRLQSGIIEDYERELADLSGTDLEQLCQSRITTWTLLIERFQHRTSPNRCVECGSTDFDLLVDNEGEMPNAFAHPGCTGKMTFVGQSHVIPATYFTLDPEGNRIRSPQ